MRTKNVMPWDVDKYKSIAAEWKRLENTYPESFSQSGLVPVLRGLFSGCSYVSWNVRPVYMTLMKQQRKTDNSTLKRLVFHPYGPVNEAWLRERLESYSRPVATFCGEPNQWACGRSTSEITNGMYCYDNAVFVSESQGGVCRPCGGSNQHMCPVKMTLPGSGFVYGCNVNFIENTSTGRCDACATGTRYSDKGKTPECRPCGVPGGSVCATGTPETQRGCYLPYYNPYWLAFEKSESTEGKANECIACADTNMSHDGEQCVKCGRKGESPCKSETKETYGSGCYAPYIRPPNAIITIQSVDSSVSYQPLLCQECGSEETYDPASNECVACGGYQQRPCYDKSNACRDPYVDSAKDLFENCEKVASDAATTKSDIGGIIIDFLKNAAEKAACEFRNGTRRADSMCKECPFGQTGINGACVACGGDRQIACEEDPIDFVDGCGKGCAKKACGSVQYSRTEYQVGSIDLEVKNCLFKCYFYVDCLEKCKALPTYARNKEYIRSVLLRTNSSWTHAPILKNLSVSPVEAWVSPRAPSGFPKKKKFPRLRRPRS